MTRLNKKQKRIMKTESAALRKYNKIKAFRGYSDTSESKVEHGREIGKLSWGINHYGYLRKGKIHCSCPLCRAKVKYNGYTISDRKKIERLMYIEDD